MPTILRNFHSEGNWLTMELSALAGIATMWPELRNADEWLRYSIKIMTKNLEEQVYPDGAQTELTTSYHHTALVHFSKLLQIADQAQIELPSQYREKIESMWNYLAYSLRPTGTNPLNNDSDLRNYRDAILLAARTFDRPDWAYVVTNEGTGLSPAGQSIIFPWAGQAIFRNGYSKEDHWAFFDVGPWGSGHQHNDNLHLSVSAFGRDFLVDSGRFSYRGETAAKLGAYARGSASHNLILIDGKGQSPGPALTSVPLDSSSYHIDSNLSICSGSVSDFQGLDGRAKHVRSVTYIKNHFWIVIDRVMTDRPRDIQTLWHWHPSCDLRVVNEHMISTDHDWGNLSIISFDPKGWEVEILEGQEYPEVQGWYSSEYNEFEPNATTVFSRRIDGNSTFVWLLYPSEHEIKKVKVEISEYRPDGVKINVKSSLGSIEVFVPYGLAGEATMR